LELACLQNFDVAGRPARLRRLHRTRSVRFARQCGCRRMKRRSFGQDVVSEHWDLTL
jgi:hypothetical protein